MSVALALADALGGRTAARRNLAIRLASILFILVIWEIVGLLVPPIFLAPFHQTVIAFFELTADGSLPRATLATLAVLFLGLSIAIILGVAVGLLMGRYRTVRWVLEPYVNGLYSTPTVAFLPLVTFWLGLYLAPKIAIVVLIAIFPVLKNTSAGVATVGADYLEPAESMRASELALFIKVIMPATLPFIMAGVRLAIGRGVVGVDRAGHRRRLPHRARQAAAVAARALEGIRARPGLLTLGQARRRTIAAKSPTGWRGGASASPG
jgi:ABC-type nitrate/sulfonate/bicarbonate transport system permease component